MLIKIYGHIIRKQHVSLKKKQPSVQQTSQMPMIDNERKIQKIKIRPSIPLIFI